MYSNLSNEFTYGKFLIIHDYMKPTNAELKKLTNSSFAKQITTKIRYSDDQKFLETINEAFRIANKPLQYGSHKIYRVDDNSVSTLYATREDYIASIYLTEDKFNKLDLAVFVFNGINKFKKIVSDWKDRHGVFLNGITNTKIPHSYDISKLDFSYCFDHQRTYGNDLLNQAIDDIKNLTKNSW